jgi:hypothetical protein
VADPAGASGGDAADRGDKERAPLLSFKAPPTVVADPAGEGEDRGSERCRGGTTRGGDGTRGGGGGGRG